MTTIVTEEQVVQAMVEARGHVISAARILKVTSRSVYNYIKQWESVRLARDAALADFDLEVRETIHEQYLKALNAGKWPAILYGLQALHYLQEGDDPQIEARRVADYQQALERVYGHSDC